MGPNRTGVRRFLQSIVCVCVWGGFRPHLFIVQTAGMGGKVRIVTRLLNIYELNEHGCAHIREYGFEILAVE